jgi:hypothetical protein
MSFDDVEIPEGLRPVKPKLTRDEMVKRAEVLLNQCRSADAKGLLSQRRVGEAQAELNLYHEELGRWLSRYCNDPRLLVLERTRWGTRVVGTTGTLAEVTEMSQAQDAYSRIDKAMQEITILWGDRPWVNMIGRKSE